MKICMVGLWIGESNGGAYVGGHVNNVVNISKYLSDLGHEIHIVTSVPVYSSSKKNLGITWATVHPIKTQSNFLDPGYRFEVLLKMILKIGRLHKKEHFDVIHGHSGYPIVAFIPAFCGNLYNIPSMHTLYCPIKKRSRLKGSFFSKFYLQKLDIINVLSNNNKKSIEEFVNLDKIKVIPPCVDLSIYNSTITSEKVRDNLGLNDRPSLLFLGNLTKTKGLHVLMESLNIVKKDIPNVKCIVGLDMPIKKNFLEKFNLSNNVILLGITDNMPQIMSAIDIFISPFLNTNGPADYPLSILEAMAIGKPIIASNVGGIPEIIKNGKTGLLVEPDDANSLSKAILFLLSDRKKMRKMGAEGSYFIENHFSSKKIAKKLEKIYTEIKQ
ncbi:MAG: glycosyltransferase family 4 protein [Candidatus Thermoplasmatota archaeon]|nr:glycosyltransferase family 4 protein [Candidatus Thermoplasmatota archaeon]